ncbi:acetylcholine receptor subunit beta-like [Crassostrea virginica]|uniref:Acetylcholine receptor subunit beta-like n=1 Tax=Crassostrea virginica TaxID=6565 RepID=A0A8B8DUY7_CRAVI|nr:acetylcholine receptor subunit beta-like [Crassostrea virginica]XP_022331463.1 acetylcholine receptor subunit beta-like [Crassostrea virginica]
MKPILQAYIGFCLLSAVLCQIGGGSPPTYSRSLETALRTELFTGYSVLQRPEDRMRVKVSLTLLTVNDMDIKNQLMSVSGYLSLSWSDDRLSWFNTSSTSQDYSNVRFLFSNEVYVWSPALIIENSVDSLTVISDKNIPMRINNQGLINWNPAGIYLVSCSSDITYYPLDQQVCTVKVSTWGYTTNEIYLVYDTQPVELGFYSENGEWELVGAVGEPTQDRARGGQSFSSLSFSITLRRRPLFHALNTILPVVLMAFLIPMVYRLPVDSGEKIGYSLTVLLAYAVYLTLISDNIPSTSVSVCYLTVFLVIVLALGVLSVLFVIMVIAAYHKGDKPVTSCMARVGHFMSRATCADHGVCCRKKQNQDVVTPIAPESNKLSAELDKKQYLEGESPEAQMTYQEYAIILDHFLFYAYFMTVTLTTFLFTLLGIVHFYTL